MDTPFTKKPRTILQTSCMKTSVVTKNPSLLAEGGGTLLRANNLKSCCGTFYILPLDPLCPILLRGFRRLSKIRHHLQQVKH